FVWNIWFYRKRELSVFSMQDFCRVVRLDPVSVPHPEDALEQLRIRVEKKCVWLARRYPQALPDLEIMRPELERKRKALWQSEITNPSPSTIYRGWIVGRYALGRKTFRGLDL
ncbi:MAG: hypothetical protein IIX81_02995, partial [Tidjanibacter sp.]|nr:hypothetical protein [Tidjanibacter sp.]